MLVKQKSKSGTLIFIFYYLIFMNVIKDGVILTPSNFEIMKFIHCIENIASVHETLEIILE